MAVVRCGACGVILDESSDTPSEERHPCGVCGALGRRFEVEVGGAQLEPRAMLAYKARHGGRGKPFVWGKVGSELYRDGGIWTRIRRHFNREADIYYEHITDAETGAVRKHTEEPLSEHQGYGSARRRTPPEVQPEEPN